MSSVQDGIYALEKASMRSTPSLRRFPNVAFETVPTFVCWHTMALSHLFEDYGMCGPTVTYWGDPAEGKGDLFHLHRQAGGWDRIGCTVFMDGSRTLLDGEAQPDWSFVTKPSVYIVRSCGLLFSWMRSLISDRFACWPFSTLLTHVFWQECLTETPESVCVPFPLLGLLELCQLAYLYCGGLSLV